jgi:hypothetical protein
MIKAAQRAADSGNVSRAPGGDPTQQLSCVFQGE